MKILLAVAGLTILVLCGVVDLGTRGSSKLNVGYFLVATGCVLGAALWRDAPEPIGSDQRAFEIYSLLAREPLSPDDLIGKLTNGQPGYEIGDAYKAVAGRLLVEGKLVIRDGNLAMASSSAERSS